MDAYNALQGCRGYAPRYPPEAVTKLHKNLVAARHVIAETCTPIQDLMSGKDLVPLLLQGWVEEADGTWLDLSGFHSALLWQGTTLLSIGELAPICQAGACQSYEGQHHLQFKASTPGAGEDHAALLALWRDIQHSKL